MRIDRKLFLRIGLLLYVGNVTAAHASAAGAS